MAGHSKWANIKHKKAKADKKKGKLFSKIMKELINAVKQGGADPKTNARLRVILDKARAAGMPQRCESHTPLLHVRCVLPSSVFRAR